MSRRFLFLLALATTPLAAQDLYQDKSKPSDARAEDLLSRLTPEEKLQMLGGTGFTTQRIDRLGIPSFHMSDGPVGLRKYPPAIAYTASVCLAAAWDQELAERVGGALGRDCRARGVHILLGPGMNLYRAPMCGRNFEYMGEDPVLAGKLAAAYIRGVQRQGVAATAKHFVANNQDFSRHKLSSDMDERTLRELYLRTFEIALREGRPECVMTSYNMVNGVHMSQNDRLNNGVLKGEWGFAGLLMSDWRSCYDTLGMVLGGLDIEMPAAKLFNPGAVSALIASGQVPQSAIDDKIRRQLRLGFRMGWFDRPQEDTSIPKDDPETAAVALDEAREGITLLKNEKNLLPLDKTTVRRIVVIGPNGSRPVTGGGGSSLVKPFRAVSVADGLRALLGASAVAVPDWPLGTEPSADVAAALKGADAVFVCVGFDSSDGIKGVLPANGEHEDYDRAYALPPGSVEMIKAAAAANPRTVVVLNAGGSVESLPWIESAPALIHSYYAGQEGGTVLAEILFGQTNPSGKLPFSWEKRWEDCPAFGNYPTREMPKANTYKEGVFLGYRYFDVKNIQPLFPFGYGLSYTRFELSNLKLAAAGDEVTATIDVRNVGPREGKETVQVYLAPPTGDLPRPVRELKAYAKVSLAVNQTKAVALRFRKADLAWWDPVSDAWMPGTGGYTVFVGDSSRNLPLKASLAL